jgi:hypothetical protein
VARALVEPKNEMVPMRLLNTKPDTVILAAGMVTATLESVELPPDSVVAGVSTTKPKLEPEKVEVLRGIVEESSADLNKTEKEQFYALLEEYADVFAFSDAEIGCTSKLQHEIHTGDAPPIRQAVRRLPLHRRSAVQQLLTSMQDNGVVQASSSPWASPIVLVRKRTIVFVFAWTTERSMKLPIRMPTLSPE